MSERLPVIVGVGNVLMGDDGVGPAVVEALRKQGMDTRVELLDAGLAFSEVLCDLDPASPLVIIDAVRGGGEPGAIYKLDPSDLDRDTMTERPAFSLHEVSILPGLQMEALSGREFTDVTIFGVEPGRLAWGEELSKPVSTAVEQLAQIISQYLDQRTATDDSSNEKTPVADRSING